MIGSAYRVWQSMCGPVLLLILNLTVPVMPAAKPDPTPEGGVKALVHSLITGPDHSPFSMPSDCAVGAHGRLYVLDGVHHRVVVYDARGAYRFQFGGQGAQPGRLQFPLGISTDADGTVYVADSGNHRFQHFSADGVLLEAVELPSRTSGPPADPTDAVADPAQDRLYIADNDGHQLYVYDLAGHRFTDVWGGPGQGRLQFRYPFLLDVSEQGYVFVVEPINTRVQVLNPTGKFVDFIGEWGTKAGQLFRPKGVALWKDRVFVTDSYLGRIQVFDMTGRFLGMLADHGGTPIKFITPTGCAVDARRMRLYVVELKADRVCRLDLE